MLFPTFTFGVFFALVLPASWLLRREIVGWKVFILGASYVFYGWWNWRLLGLIIAVTVINEFFAVAIADARSDDARRKRLAMLAVAINLVLLGFFKYYGFFIDSLESNFGVSGPVSQMVLPVGISFFTFQAISYVIDVYRHDTAPVPLLDFAVYLAFFPQLVAGPIVRASEFLPQLRDRRPPSRVNFGTAVLLIGSGLFKKVVLSSYLDAAIVRDVFATPGEFSSIEILVGVYGYAIQIYADFSGYTDIAIGIALLLGFDFPQNFDRPYTSVSVQDFWRRWHMSLSRWLRDYLYFPLGGNRGGTLLTYRNLLITMVLGGLWHGAAMTFVAWGLLQGLGLAGERFLSSLRGEPDKPIERQDVRLREIAELNLGTKIQPWREDPTSPTPFAPMQVRNLAVGRFITFHFVCFSWILFRSDSFGTAGEILRGLASVPDSVGAISPWLLLVIAGSLAAQFFPQELTRQFRAGFSQLHPLAHGAVLGIWISLVVSLGPEGVAPFIYFQF